MCEHTYLLGERTHVVWHNTTKWLSRIMSHCCQTGIMGLLCKFNCNIQRAFDYVAFQPPPPSYTVDDENNFRLNADLHTPQAHMDHLANIAKDVECFRESIRTNACGSDSELEVHVFLLRKKGAPIHAFLFYSRYMDVFYSGRQKMTSLFVVFQMHSGQSSLIMAMALTVVGVWV